ncbi:hypothetical protein SERLADRAFT_477348 [Serpula lacrymans var. lacrymans S7.9]|uniref:Uncharacterized protein n=1 Tax=Serpula lacrymans var. lacrymans (strain S7.9) TaxID=578457 RepID=F8P8V5_SERL9|nr:uncharacterized protein SERLADRAFT_477348 [Serpula lacrymans var. lacrymans S7.9]EGO20861.1 hypothetical protein SERLADRAFT_477348 [Serpula lacrymans var. lacrymans S7.9]
MQVRSWPLSTSSPYNTSAMPGWRCDIPPPHSDHHDTLNDASLDTDGAHTSSSSISCFPPLRILLDLHLHANHSHDTLSCVLSAGVLSMRPLPSP